MKCADNTIIQSPMFRAGRAAKHRCSGIERTHFDLLDLRVAQLIEEMLPYYLRRNPQLKQRHTSTNERYSWLRDVQVRVEYQHSEMHSSQRLELGCEPTDLVLENSTSYDIILSVWLVLT